MYRMSTETPAAPGSRSRRSRIAIPMIPRYASVLPPPVGNHSRSAISRSDGRRPRARKVDQDERDLEGPPLALRGRRRIAPPPLRWYSCRLRCWAMARLVSWNARRTFSSVRRSCESRLHPVGRIPGSPMCSWSVPPPRRPAARCGAGQAVDPVAVLVDEPLEDVEGVVRGQGVHRQLQPVTAGGLAQQQLVSGQVGRLDPSGVVALPGRGAAVPDREGADIPEEQLLRAISTRRCPPRWRAGAPQ